MQLIILKTINTIKDIINNHTKDNLYKYIYLLISLF